MRRSRKIAYSGAASAIGIAAIAVARFLPLTIPYMAAGIAVYIILSKCGYLYGFLTYLVISGFGLLVGITAALPFIFLFGLHIFVSYPLTKLNGKIKPPALYYPVRAIIIAIFFNIAFLGVYYLADTAMMDIPKLMDILGGYAVLAMLGTAAFIIYDFASTIVTAYVARKLPA